MNRKFVKRSAIIVIGLILISFVYLHYRVNENDRDLDKAHEAVKNVYNSASKQLRMSWAENIIEQEKKLNKDPEYEEQKRVLEPPKSPVHKQPLNPTDTSSDQNHYCSKPIGYPRTDLDMREIYDNLKFDNPPGDAWKQGFPITYSMDQWSKQPLEVFIVPHSHQDPGWIMTVDQYFESQTKPSLDSSLRTLSDNPNARFIYAEMSYFSMWFDLLTKDQKTTVKKLLDKGQWEITSGGWVMPDEATTHYYAVVDQLIEGHHWLLDNLNYRPNTSWSIDPFGQSLTMPYLLKKMGFPNMVINRIHYEVKRYLAERKSLEFSWRQPWDQSGHTDMFAHVLPFFSYDIPHTCGPDPSICCQFDFLRISKYSCPWGIRPVPITNENVAQKASALADQYRKKSTLYRNGNLVLIPLGDDFRYETIDEWNVQMDNYKKLIDHINRHPEFAMKVQIATLSDYFTAVHQHAQAAIGHIPQTGKFPTFQGDLFTYADREQDYWSGYFTSRPYQKWLSRVLESELRCAELLFTFVAQHIHSHQSFIRFKPMMTDLYKDLVGARRSLGLFQHHDSITGTSTPEVVHSRTSDLKNAIRNSRKISALCLGHLLEFDLNTDLNNRLTVLGNALVGRADVQHKLADMFQPITPFGFFDKELELPSDVLELGSKDGDAGVIYYYNPSTIPRSTILTMMVPGHVTNVEIQTPNPNASPMPVQLESVRTVNLVHFGPFTIPPLGAQRFHVRRLDGRGSMAVQRISESLAKPLTNQPEIENEFFKLTFNEKTGLLESILDKSAQRSIRVSIEFMLYDSSTGPSNSGAYLFVPNGPPKPIEPFDRFELVQGPLVDEVVLRGRVLTHVIRLHKSGDLQSKTVEIENLVQLDSANIINSDLVMNIKTNLETDSRTFYTDSNCFQYVRRTYFAKIPIQGNLYPASCGFFIQDRWTPSTPATVSRLNLFTAHPVGVTSPHPGSLQIWLDRRASRDDGRGLVTPLRSAGPSLSRFRLFVERIPTNGRDESRHVPQLTLMAQHIQSDLIHPIRRFTPPSDMAANLKPAVQLIPQNAKLPCDYEIVTLRTFYEKSNVAPQLLAKSGLIGLILRRSAHACDHTSSPKPANDRWLSYCYDQPSSKIDVANFFAQLGVSQAIPTTLNLIPSSTGPTTASHRTPTIQVDPMELEAFYLV